MKTIKQGVIIAAILLTSIAQTFAIEGLKISVHCPDVWLSWPSVDGETYIVQYRATLATNDAWATLTNSLPAVADTNRTTFVHSNMVDCPPGQIFGLMSGGGSGGDSASLDSASEQEDSKWAEPMIMPKDESSPPAPLAIFPPGLDLSGWIIIWPDGSTEEWTKEFAEKYFVAQAEEGQGGSQLDSGGSGNNTGFYRVVRVGIHLFGVTNGVTWSGEKEILIEMGSLNTDEVDINLHAGGFAADGVEIEMSSTGAPEAKWNTSAMPNGTYDIYLVADFGDHLPLMYSPTNTVTVDNDLFFEEFTATFGDQIWVRATWKVIEAIDWHVRMYDESGSELAFTNQNGQQVFLGSSDADGEISVTWNLLDPQSNPVTNEVIRADFYVKPQSDPDPATKKGSWFWKKEISWGSDDFITAWGEFEYPSGTQDAIDEMMRLSVNDNLAHVLADHPYTLNPPNGWNTGFSFMLTHESKSNLLAKITDPNNRNFFWFGHGGPENFGYSFRDENQNRLEGVRVTTKEIKEALGNKGFRIRHAYRFVFLHSCCGLTGGLPKAFGIDRKPRSIAHYNTKNVKPRAFVGATDEGSGPFDPIEYSELGQSLSIFFGMWMTEAFDVGESLDEAKTPETGRIELDEAFAVGGALDLRRID